MIEVHDICSNFFLTKFLEQTELWWENYLFFSQNFHYILRTKIYCGPKSTIYAKVIFSLSFWSSLRRPRKEHLAKRAALARTQRRNCFAQCQDLLNSISLTFSIQFQLDFNAISISIQLSISSKWSEQRLNVELETGSVSVRSVQVTICLSVTAFL